MLTIDGSMGEGGGQVLRTSLALSLVTGRGFRLEKIRARRCKPGLRAQHLTCVKAATRVGAAEASGVALGSTELEFRPQALLAVDLELDLGTAGSTALVAQTVLPALLRAPGPSRVRLRGGTHNPLAPSFEFLKRVYLPWIERLGASPEATLERPGFFPKGGGRVDYRLTPGRLRPFELRARGSIREIRAEAYLANLPDSVAERELALVREAFRLPASACRVIRPRRPRGPGNAVLITIESEHATEVITAYGMKATRAEAVARQAIEEAERYLAADVPVGEHGADQLLLLCALAGGGAFETLTLSEHTTTQCELIPRFLPDLAIERRELSAGRWELSIRRH
ncbi:MAG: RNA 3'-terminal phosphate cyclase [Planctomycetes bacterium]|nr:RNA 3'-terminal phosphate cyclase [Planctomycetota bacterium]